MSHLYFTSHLQEYKEYSTRQHNAPTSTSVIESALSLSAKYVYTNKEFDSDFSCSQCTYTELDTQLNNMDNKAGQRSILYISVILFWAGYSPGGYIIKTSDCIGAAPAVLPFLATNMLSLLCLFPPSNTPFLRSPSALSSPPPHYSLCSPVSLSAEDCFPPGGIL